MKTLISSKGQIVLPAELRQLDDIQAGQQFSLERLNVGEYLLKREPTGDNAGVVDWLLSCPSDDWFQPLPSDSTEFL
ncbi:MAG TPA: AbrB/MazE/SpoVT family DNA-binding domain-containing protein [Planctomycetaceae bacterium]|nr:AbrB/MazE/SpoVT family DNA-binding domain-containing protein [Planctomycetaceae bacterium]HQZ67665.1 AbrB/MazE/SpoVT family DNA-binding domain-containing protein [Planctomycetaceae bacterium]